MNNILNWVIFVGVGVGFCFFIGCSTAIVRVLPGENGIVHAIARDIKKDTAEDASSKAAIEYCKKNNKSVVVLKEKSEYTGTMDEGTRNVIHNASMGAQMAGFANQNQGLMSAGEVGTATTSDRDYKSEVEFKCE